VIFRVHQGLTEKVDLWVTEKVKKGEAGGECSAHQDEDDDNGLYCQT
jgi:hypothetical protein